MLFSLLLFPRVIRVVIVILVNLIPVIIAIFVILDSLATRVILDIDALLAIDDFLDLSLLFSLLVLFLLF